MPSVETREAWRPPHAGGERPRGEAILSAYGLHFADEALSAVRHDVLNRMTALGALGFELRQGLRPPRAEVRERLQDLNRQIAMVCESVSRRLSPPRSEPPPRCSIREVVERVAALSQGPIGLPSAPAPRLWAAIEPVQLGVSLLCLVENALEACAQRPRGRVRLLWRSEDDDRVAIEVVDNGPGLPAAVEARAFERFFTTKPGHAGLGLCVARTILLRWRGELELQCTPGESGTRVTVRLPAAARRARAARG
jgi:C4-dicarboxylate-specific signal transduction histidine kinase